MIHIVVLNQRSGPYLKLLRGNLLKPECVSTPMPAGVRLHVATKDAASGRREQYITVDGMRYSALSRDCSGR